MEYCGENRDVADPWYTGNFAKTYDDVLRGCRALLEKIKNEK
jgi:protein-tyrosine phosphatase